jgi:hypothetical protein
MKIEIEIGEKEWSELKRKIQMRALFVETGLDSIQIEDLIFNRILKAVEDKQKVEQK